MIQLRSSFLKVAFLLVLFLLPALTYAKSPADFGSQYNLFVTDENRDQPVPYSKGIQILESFFLGAPLKAEVENPQDMMSQKEFLMAFEMLRANAAGEQVIADDGRLYYQTWLTARRHNWLPKPEMTYGNMQEFLYRYQVSQAHADLPYHEGLVLNDAEITADRFTTVPEVKMYQNKILSQIREVRQMGDSTSESTALEAKLEGHYLAFLKVEEEIIWREHPSNKLPGLPDDIKQKILENGLNQILNHMTYNYSRDTSNRRFNVVEGAMAMNGKVFQPGEEISFTKTLEQRPQGLSGFESGWVIQGNEEVWEYGGGLCGSATLFFTPSWRGGLEIVYRRNHSSYFSSLYPPDALGIDATIYFGSTDVIMKNNTASPVLYYVYNNTATKEITMYVVGNSPYTDVRIEGPIKTGTNAYKFLRHMTLPDGQVISETVTSRYNRMY